MVDVTHERNLIRKYFRKPYYGEKCKEYTTTEVKKMIESQEHITIKNIKNFGMALKLEMGKKVCIRGVLKYKIIESPTIVSSVYHSVQPQNEVECILSYFRKPKEGEHYEYMTTTEIKKNIEVQEEITFDNIITLGKSLKKIFDKKYFIRGVGKYRVVRQAGRENKVCFYCGHVL